MTLKQQQLQQQQQQKSSASTSSTIDVTFSSDLEEQQQGVVNGMNPLNKLMMIEKVVFASETKQNM